jgi:hypothetical protein
LPAEVDRRRTCKQHPPMLQADGFRFRNSFAALPEGCHARVAPLLLADAGGYRERERLRLRLRRPYDEHPEMADYASALPDRCRDPIGSCSS